MTNPITEIIRPTKFKGLEKSGPALIASINEVPSNANPKPEKIAHIFFLFILITLQSKRLTLWRFSP